MSSYSSEPPKGSKPVPGFLDYRVSKTGVVYSRKIYGSKIGRIGPWWALKPKTGKNFKGHLYVDLFRVVGRSERFFVHCLVLTAFVGPCPKGMESRHLNDVPGDNRLENLKWGTRKENVQDALRNGKLPCGEKRKEAKSTDDEIREIRRLYKEGWLQSDIADKFGLRRQKINKIIKGQIWGRIV